MGEYIVIYVLTMVLCSAPEGKTVCEFSESTAQFVTPIDCLTVRSDLLQLVELSSIVIVNESKSKCEPQVIAPETFEDRETAMAKGEERMLIARKLFDMMMNN